MSIAPRAVSASDTKSRVSACDEWGMWRPLLESFFELLAPLRCAACERESEGALFCEGCALSLEYAEEDAPALFLYSGPIRDAVHELKYRGRSDLGPRLGVPMAEKVLRSGISIDRVMPIPLHPSRQRARGYNQAALLAAKIASLLGVPLDRRSLVRTRVTPPQAELDREERLQNLHSAFEIRAKEGELDGAKILLVDDVMTTGATLDAAAEVLFEAGVRRVDAFVLALAEA